MLVILCLIVNITQNWLVLNFKNTENVVKGNRFNILHKKLNIYDIISKLINYFNL